MPLASLAQLKAALGIPSGDTSRDSSLQLALDSAEELVLRATGYSLTPLSDRVDIYENIRVGSPLQLTKRPVTGTPVVTGRVTGATDAELITLAASLADPNKGRLALLGLEDVSGFYYPGAYPPRAEPSGYFRWRGFTWGVVKVTYDVAALDPIPPALVTATIQAAAALDELIKSGVSGPVTSVTVGNVSESKGGGLSGAFAVSLPPNARGFLAGHLLPGRNAQMAY